METEAFESKGMSEGMIGIQRIENNCIDGVNFIVLQLIYGSDWIQSAPQNIA